MSLPERANLKDLKAYVEKWQERLRLKDWEIKIKILPRSKMVNKDAWAECLPLPDRLSAMIHVCGAKPTKRDADDCDWEETVLHELIHIPLYGVGNWEDPSKLQIEEQAVERFAAALMSLDRELQRVTTKTDFFLKENKQ